MRAYARVDAGVLGVKKSTPSGRPDEVRAGVLARYDCARDNDGGDGAPVVVDEYYVLHLPAAFSLAQYRPIPTATNGHGSDEDETKQNQDDEQYEQPSNDAQFS